MPTKKKKKITKLEQLIVDILFFWACFFSLCFYFSDEIRLVLALLLTRWRIDRTGPFAECQNRGAFALGSLSARAEGPARQRVSYPLYTFTYNAYIFYLNICMIRISVEILIITISCYFRLFPLLLLLLSLFIYLFNYLLTGKNLFYKQNIV